jgi:hypothetical protein
MYEHVEYLCTYCIVQVRMYTCILTRMVSTLDVPTRGHIHEEYLRTQ